MLGDKVNATIFIFKIFSKFFIFYLKGGKIMKRLDADERITIQASLIRGDSISNLTN